MNWWYSLNTWIPQEEVLYINNFLKLKVNSHIRIKIEGHSNMWKPLKLHHKTNKVGNKKIWFFDVVFKKKMDGIFFIHLQTLHYHIYSMTYRLSVTSSVNFGRIYQFEWTIFTNNNDIKLYTRTRINNSTIDMTNELGQHKRAAARVLYNSNGRSSSSEFYALQKIFSQLALIFNRRLSLFKAQNLFE